MKYSYRQTQHREYVGDDKGDLYLNHLKYFEFHHYPGEKLHSFWAIATILILLFKIDDLFSINVFYGLLGIYVMYIAIFTKYLLTKKICRYKGYFLYPNAMIRFFKKRKKSTNSAI